MYIIYLYIIYILFISLSGVSKILSKRTRRMYVTTLLLFVICYLLWLRPQRAASVGASRRVLRPYCYLLFVMIEPAAQGKCAPLLKEQNVSRWFAIPP